MVERTKRRFLYIGNDQIRLYRHKAGRQCGRKHTFFSAQWISFPQKHAFQSGNDKVKEFG